MPVYAYRREDGSTFEIKQKFLDDPLTICPTTGQKVIRIVQNAGIIFKGSGFYVTDNKGGSSGRSQNGGGKSADTGDSNGSASTESKSDPKPETKSDTKTESKSAVPG